MKEDAEREHWGILKAHQRIISGQLKVLEDHEKRIKDLLKYQHRAALAISILSVLLLLGFASLYYGGMLNADALKAMAEYDVANNDRVDVLQAGYNRCNTFIDRAESTGIPMALSREQMDEIGKRAALINKPYNAFCVASESGIAHSGYPYVDFRCEGFPGPGMMNNLTG